MRRGETLSGVSWADPQPGRGWRDDVMTGEEDCGLHCRAELVLLIERVGVIDEEIDQAGQGGEHEEAAAPAGADPDQHVRFFLRLAGPGGGEGWIGIGV